MRDGYVAVVGGIGLVNNLFSSSISSIVGIKPAFYIALDIKRNNARLEFPHLTLLVLKVIFGGKGRPSSREQVVLSWVLCKEKLNASSKPSVHPPDTGKKC